MKWMCISLLSTLLCYHFIRYCMDRLNPKKPENKERSKDPQA